MMKRGIGITVLAHRSFSPIAHLGYIPSNRRLGKSAALPDGDKKNVGHVHAQPTRLIEEATHSGHKNGRLFHNPNRLFQIYRLASIVRQQPYPLNLIEGTAQFRRQ